MEPELLDYWQIRDTHLGDQRPQAWPWSWRVTNLSDLPVRDLESLIEYRTQIIDGLDAWLDAHRNNPAVNDGQWLDVLFDRAYSIHRRKVGQDALDKLRARRRRSAQARAPQSRPRAATGATPGV